MAKRSNYDDEVEDRGKRRRTNDGGRRSSLAESRSVDCNVFVGNLKYETRWQALKDHMRRAGNVDSVSH